MNYIKEINSFYDWLETNSLSDSAIVLWHALMFINNRAGWITEFAVAISAIELKTGLKKDAVIRARHRLQQAGRIDFSSRSGQQSAIYRIIPFESNCVALTDTNRYTNREQTATQTATQTASITKLNETKQKIIKTPISPSKTKFGEFVTMTNAEYGKLVGTYGEEFTKRCIEVLDNYKGSSGKKYKDDYRTILNWVVSRVTEERSKHANNWTSPSRDRELDALSL